MTWAERHTALDVGILDKWIGGHSLAKTHWDTGHWDVPLIEYCNFDCGAYREMQSIGYGVLLGEAHTWL